MDAWQDILLQIRDARHKLSITKQMPWFRGVKKCSYELLPKLFRDKGIDHQRLEREIYHRFMYTLYADNKNSWDYLVKLQHFGVPTRLLDWTDSFAVALFFALDFDSEDDDSVQPCVWMTNPFTLSAKAKKANDIWIEYFHTEPSTDYYKCFLKGENQWPYESPIPFVPPTSNSRIIAQRGFFTVHGNDRRPLEDQCPKHVAKIEIPKSAWGDAREFLELSGTDHRGLFPDLAGFSEYINKQIVKNYKKPE